MKQPLRAWQKTHEHIQKSVEFQHTKHEAQLLLKPRPLDALTVFLMYFPVTEQPMHNVDCTHLRYQHARQA